MRKIVPFSGSIIVAVLDSAGRVAALWALKNSLFDPSMRME